MLGALDAYNQRLVKRVEIKGFELKNEPATDGCLRQQNTLAGKNRFAVVFPIVYVISGLSVEP